MALKEFSSSRGEEMTQELPLNEIQAKQLREYVEKAQKERLSRWDYFDEGFTRSWEVHVTPELIIMHADGVEDFNPWYDGWRTGQNKSPFGPAIVPPTFFAQQAIDSVFFITEDGRESEGGINAGDNMEIIAPCSVGSLIRITGKLVSKYIKRERRYMQILYTIEDVNTGELYFRDTRKELCQYKKVSG